MFGVTCTCSWLELFVVIWSWVKNDAAPFLGVGGLVGGYVLSRVENNSVEENYRINAVERAVLPLVYLGQNFVGYSGNKSL